MHDRTIAFKCVGVIVLDASVFYILLYVHTSLLLYVHTSPSRLFASAKLPQGCLSDAGVDVLTFSESPIFPPLSPSERETLCL